MSPISAAEVGRRFRALAPTDRRAFVAALWEASGWSVVDRPDDTSLVIRQAGIERRLLIRSPGRFRSPDVTDADVVVGTEATASLREAAEDAGATFLTPTDLRDRLLYRLARANAEPLARAHLGCSLDADEAEEAEGTSRWLPSMPAISTDDVRTRLPGRRTLAAVVVVAALVGVAVVGPSLAPSGSAPVVPDVNTSYTPDEAGALGGTGTEEAADGERPPAGLTKNEVKNSSALAAATKQSLDENGWFLRVSREGPDRTVWNWGGDQWIQYAQKGTDGRYSVEWRSWYVAEDEAYREDADIYGDGETEWVRQISQKGENRSTSYHSRPAESAAGIDPLPSKIAGSIVTYLSTNESEVTCVGTLESSGDCFAYQVEATGTPSTFEEDVRDYSAVASVSDTGVVTGLRVEYTLPRQSANGERELVTFGYEIHGTGEVNVDVPAWLDDAKSATSNETATTSTPRD